MKLSTIIAAPLYYLGAAVVPPICMWVGGATLVGSWFGVKDDVIGNKTELGLVVMGLAALGIGMVLACGMAAITLQLMGIPLPLGYVGSYMAVCAAVTAYILLHE